MGKWNLPRPAQVRCGCGPSPPRASQKALLRFRGRCSIMFEQRFPRFAFSDVRCTHSFRDTERPSLEKLAQKIVEQSAARRCTEGLWPDRIHPALEDFHLFDALRAPRPAASPPVVGCRSILPPLGPFVGVVRGGRHRTSRIAGGGAVDDDPDSAFTRTDRSSRLRAVPACGTTFPFRGRIPPGRNAVVLAAFCSCAVRRVRLDVKVSAIRNSMATRSDRNVETG